MLSRASVGALCVALSIGAYAQGSSGTLKRISETRSINLGHRTDSVPFSFISPDKQPAGYTVDLCKRVVAGLQQQLKLAELKISWVPVTAHLRSGIFGCRHGAVDQ